MNSIVTIKNGRDSKGSPIELVVEDGRIVSMAETIESVRGEIVDAGKKVIAPSLVDLHTHLREPGKEDAETVESGSRAAVKGGFGAISAMPNTDPVGDTAGIVEQIYARGQATGLCTVFPIGAVTEGQKGERLAEILAMAESKANVRIFSDDGHCVADPVIMRRALEYVKIFDGVIAQHAQEPSLTRDAQMNEGIISARLGLRGWPAVAEEAIIARDVLLTDHVQSRLHICHVSTAGSVEIIRWAKSRGIQVTAEVTPHHLLLTDSRAETFDPVYKVNPPLRTERDVQALREGLADGTIDIIATDHAPHPQEAKECEWGAAAFGMIGLESALGIAHHAMVKSGLISLDRLFDVMSTRPAEIGGYVDHTTGLAVGRPAHLIMVDVERSWEIDRESGLSKSRNTPFHGMEIGCFVSDVMFNGNWVVREGTVTA